MINIFTAVESNIAAVIVHIELQAMRLPSPPPEMLPPTPPPIDDIINDDAINDTLKLAMPPLPPPPPPLPVIAEDGIYDSMSTVSVFSSTTDRTQTSAVALSHTTLASTPSTAQPLSSISIHDLQSVQLRKTDNKLAKTVSAPPLKCLSPNGKSQFNYTSNSIQ